MKRLHAYTALTLGAALLLLQGCGGGGGYGGGGGGGGTGPIVTIAIVPTTATVTINGTQQYMATAKDANGNVISGVSYNWASSNNSIATVDGNGLATGKAAGTAMITASFTYSGGIYGMNGTTITSNSATLTVTAADRVMGTAAVGHAFANALVMLKDAQGQTEVAMTDGNGRYQIAVSGLTAPFLIKVADNQGRTLFSLGTGAGVVNIDPLTDAMLRAWYQAHGTTVENAFANPRAQAAPDAEALKSLNAALTTLLAKALAVQGLDATHVNLISTPFTADGTGMDGLLDHTSVSLESSRILVANGLAGGSETEIRFDAASHALNFQVEDGSQQAMTMTLKLAR